MVADVADVLKEARALVTESTEKRNRAVELITRIQSLQEEYTRENAKLDIHLQSATVIGTVADTSVKNTLTMIEGVINKALAVIFPLDPREIKLVPVMYNDAYPHFKAVLYTGVERNECSFKFSGTGLAQIISFLFTISFIDTRKGRPLLILDELLNGLHPNAKKLIRDMVRAVSDRFQFVMVEYGMDIGKEYLIERKGNYSEVTHYEGAYYHDLHEQELLDVEAY